MKTSTIIFLVIGMLLLIFGAALFVIPLASSGWDFSALGDNRYQTKSYEITDEFTKVSIDVITSDVIVLPSTDGKVKVVSFERVKETNEVTTADGTLSIRLNDTSKWYDRITLFNTREPRITVYLPVREFESFRLSVTTGDVSLSSALTFGTIDIDGTTGDVEGMSNATGKLGIHLTTGDVDIANITAGEIKIKNTTGDIDLERINCAGAIQIDTGTGEMELTDITALSLSTTGTTGDVELARVNAAGAFTLKRTTGDVSFRALDALSIEIDVSSGDVRGSVVKPMMFTASATTGNIRIPAPEAGGICRVTTTTGDITITVDQ